MGRNRKNRCMMTKKYIRQAVGDIATDLPPNETYLEKPLKALKSEPLKKPLFYGIIKAVKSRKTMNFHTFRHSVHVETVVLLERK